MSVPPPKRARLLTLLWLAALCAAIFVATIPATLAVETMMAICLVVVAIVVRPFAKYLVARNFLLILTALVMARYWYWRATATLPSMDDPISFVAAVLLLAVETYMIAIFMLGGFMMADPSQPYRPAPQPLEDLPKVDILVPSLNEPYDMLALTLAAASQIDYPKDKLRVVLCDDGGTDQRCNDPDPEKAAAARERRWRLSALCDRLGVIYHTRMANSGAKAGNLNSAMARLDGDLVAIFDADHAPTPDFLARTVGYFAEEPELFLVQTPHMFLNADPIARNLKMGDGCPPENEMFYGTLHEGLNRWGGAFFCGSAALLRRKALDEVGGISGDTITEDAETALRLHGRGWTSRYLNHAMIAGLQPETFASLVKQRGRWATGMIQLFRLRNPLLARGLTLRQRLSYLNSMSFWFFPVTRMALLLTPLVYIFFNVELFVTNRAEALTHMLAYIGVSMVVQNALFARTRWPLQSEIFEIALSPYLMKAVFGTLLKPRGARFNVTSKDESVEITRVSEIAWPLIGLFLLLAAGVAMAGWRWVHAPGDRAALSLVGGWAIVNMLLTGAAMRAVIDSRQRRAAPRVSIQGQAGLRMAGESDTTIPVQFVDVSSSGCGLLVNGPAASSGIHRDVRVELVTDVTGIAAYIPSRITDVLPRQGKLFVGLEFYTDRSAEADRALAKLLHGDSHRWAQLRDRSCQPRGLIRGMIWALTLSIRGPISVFTTMIKTPGRQTKKDQIWDEARPISDQAFASPGPSTRVSSPAKLSTVPSANTSHAPQGRTDSTTKKTDDKSDTRPTFPSAPSGLGAIVLALCLQGVWFAGPTEAQTIALPDLGGNAEASTEEGATGDGTETSEDGDIASDAEGLIPLDSILTPAPLGGPIPLPDLGLSTAPSRIIVMQRAPLRTSAIDAGQDPIRLGGERAVAEFLMLLPPDAKADELAVTLQTSAYVLPEQSTVHAYFNGFSIGSQPLDQIAGPGEVRFDIPPHVPLNARNTVRLELTQTHRIHCGADASYELWTDIYLGLSGVDLPDEMFEGDSLAVTLPRIAAQLAEGLPLVVDAQGVSEATVNTALAALRSAIDGPLPLAIGGRAPEGAPVLRIVAGAGTGFQSTDEGLSLSADSQGELALDTLIRTGPPKPVAVVPGQTVTLADLGYAGGQVKSHLWNDTISFTLPDTYLPATGGRGVVLLDYANIAGLSQGSVMRVLINGTAVRSIPLNSDDFVAERGLTIRFDAGLLQAGTNTLSFEASLPGPQTGLACPTTTVLAAEIGATSTLMVPTTPAMVRPGLGPVLRNLTPGGVSAWPSLALGMGVGPGADAELLSREVASAIPVAQSLAAPDAALRALVSDTLPALRLGAFSGQVPIFVDLLSAAPDLPQTLTPPAPEPAPATAQAAPAGSSLFDIAAANAEAEAGASGLDFMANAGDGPVSASLSKVMSILPPALVNGAIDMAARLGNNPSADLRNWLRNDIARHGLARDGAVLMQLDASEPDTAYLVMGKFADPARIAGAVAEARAENARLDGHVAIWRPNSGWTVWVDRSRLPVLHEAIRADNIHAIVGGYLSARPQYFVLGLLAITLLVTFIAVVGLLRTREKV